ncbi:DNA polymerase III subunit delta' [Marinisporobacter balticus]|uniref:DNA polymerase III subunit delta' n=1 Tax=Marinisporobacter balticus TaxID=2018667 RepID=A0A4R2LH21_9FIRM|nr:DNA polymerase III subunit delta' [Marinisporobacter balticus]TCO78625.1 DNA polymerase III delta prime subunit [Marinisporobacter balticus]
MGFNDIIGQEKTVNYFKRAISNEKIAHAYIFEGPSGIGKVAIATAFAKGIQCKNYHEDACNICISCLKVNGNNHPDIKMIEPEGKSIKNKQIEEMQQDLLRKPYEGNKKIYIIKHANQMTVSAQNRLLKTLEEPPQYAVILLMSANSNSFLPTIKSRCQILKFNRMGQNDIEQILTSKYGMNQEEGRVLAAFSDGILGKAIQLKESDVFRIKREETIEVIENVLKKDPLVAFDAVEFFQKYKDDINEILDYILFWFRDLLMLIQTGSDKFLINMDKKNTLQKHRGHIAYERIGNIINIIEKTKNDIKANVNFQLAIEMMLLTIQEV